VKEVIPGVFTVERTQGSNVYLVVGEVTLLIDAGFPMDARRVIRQLGGGSNGNPDLIVATHCHIDHMGSIRRLKDALGAHVAAHEADACVMEGRAPYQSYKVDALRTLYYKALAPLFRYENVTVDTMLSEGDVLESLGGLETIHVPGHTAGSIMLYQAERGVLFSGDTLRNEKGVLQGPPPEFSPGIDEAFWHIKEKVLSLEFGTLLPGHGEPLLEDARAEVERMMRALGRLE
jgi:glyoxylase-like metal-dependent hydrolase (beta-lactamase superfamily II)